MKGKAFAAAGNCLRIANPQVCRSGLKIRIYGDKNMNWTVEPGKFKVMIDAFRSREFSAA